jgi:TRAP-type transport system large permease protein
MTIAVFIVSLLAAMALGMPIAYALLVCGVAMMIQMGMFDSQILVLNLLTGADNYVLMSVPFFMLAGEFMNVGGLSRRIVDLAMALVGHIHGGLGYACIIAAIILASLSGSAVADTAAVSALLVPMMRNAGYEMNRSSGLIAASGIIAPVIPPSIGLIVFGVTAQVSINKLFVAGIFPGLLMAVAVAGTWWMYSRRDAAAPLPRQTGADVLKAFGRGFWALVLPVIIVGGMKLGAFTPTEAAVVAAAYSMFIGLCVYREMTVAQIYPCLVRAAKTTSIVMFLAAAAFVSAWLITLADLPGEVARMLAPFQHDKILLMGMMMIIVFIVGTAMDFIPTILILTPVLVPICKQAGIDPVYFGILFVMNNAIGLITPPVGTVLNVVCGVAGIPMDKIMQGVWPFLVAETLVLALLVLFPSLVTGVAHLFY